MSRRRGLIVAGAAVLILVVAAGFLYLRGGSTPVSIDSAVQQFRAGTNASAAETKGPVAIDKRVTRAAAVASRTAPSRAPLARQAASRRALPAEGVYVYATSGSDDVDVLGGSTHHYPSQTTITVRHAGCGFVERWDVLKERWDERESCRTSGGDVLRRLTSYHEFFRHGDERTFTCSGYSYPAGDEPGATWTVRCSTPTTMTVTKLRAVAWENVVIAGTRVRTLHVHASSQLSGEQVGTSERDVWGATASGIVVRERARIDSDSSQPVFGKTHYHEQYEIRLTSLSPQR